MIVTTAYGLRRQVLVDKVRARLRVRPTTGSIVKVRVKVAREPRSRVLAYRELLAQR